MENQIGSVASQGRQDAVNLDSLMMRVVKRGGKTSLFDQQKIVANVNRCLSTATTNIDHGIFMKEVIRNIFDGISTKDLEKALILSATSFIELDPAYDELAVRFYLQRIYKEIIGESVTEQTLDQRYRQKFIDGIKYAIAAGRLDSRLGDFPLEELAKHLNLKRDTIFGYMGIHTIYERYLLRCDSNIIETPQAFWMRIAMGLCLQEGDKIGRAVEFYNLLSQLNYVSSTPTLFHSGMVHAQMSSCYLTYVDDDLNHIFKCLNDNANLAKWSGGIGSSWTALRSTGAPVKSVNVESQGLIPFLKIANDVVAAINRSGSRRGAAVVYLEVWHLDYEDFLDLRRNTGDERRRAHDMSTASWIPDLFMKRVLEDGEWTMFSPNDTPDLHETFGKKFETLYLAYEENTRTGKLTRFKKISATQLWRKMLSRLFETGHPWITFKDPCNVRSPQDHVGVIHSSNLCTEITLNTSREETAVCNIGSINLSHHVADGKLDEVKLTHTIKTAIRMLDNVIDDNFYPTEEAKISNFRHRPIGLGIMGLQDILYKLDIPFDDQRALEFSDQLMEKISYHAILASSELAKERSAYSSYKGSKWSRNLFPVDTINLLEQERGMPIEVSRKERLDWAPVREHVKRYGMRNSNVMAIAPTATISNISGCYPSIEPIYKNMYVKANMSGEFTVINKYLVQDLKTIGLWNKDMLDTIKYFDGNIQMVDEIPEHIKRKYKEAFDIDAEWLVQLAAVRAKWIDQSQSLNIFIQGVSGKKIHDIYMNGWKAGLKTFYYARTMGASQIEKSTLDAKKFGYTQKRQYEKMPTPAIEPEEPVASCKLDNEDCESCQ